MVESDVKPTKPPNASAHFKTVPDTRELRDRIRAEAFQFAKSLDRSKPFTKPVLQKLGEELLKTVGLDR